MPHALATSSARSGRAQVALGTATAAFPLLLLAMRRDRSTTLSPLLRIQNELHIARLVSAELTTATILVGMVL